MSIGNKIAVNSIGSEDSWSTEDRASHEASTKRVMDTLGISSPEEEARKKEQMSRDASVGTGTKPLLWFRTQFQRFMGQRNVPLGDVGTRVVEWPKDRQIGTLPAALGIFSGPEHGLMPQGLRGRIRGLLQRKGG